MLTCSLENDRMEIDIPTLRKCQFPSPRLIGSQPITKPTQLGIKSDFVSFNCDSKHTSRNTYVCVLPFSLPFRCLKNFHQLWLVKIFSQAVSVLSHACQRAAFDSNCNTWEYLQYVDLCLSWDCHFITSFSRHIDSSLFPSSRQGKSGPGPGSHTMEQCYKMKPNRPGPCKWFYLQGTILLWTDMIRRCGHDQ